ncbi:DUF2142 domain-containing protein [Leifsonia sp. F6_8S_P_1B]|uniref:DUF2142 domain-containing protein n=1 Tax=Leifsonia williamsii TaxID=3035919 RepID=A0ABT8KBS3_9MICO|nr:DUF2142 domain-containing protein [Leifsonia williamsii]MDN4614428.1 DUF2142 domain-containing protein [Leifsonia williamsii]
MLALLSALWAWATPPSASPDEPAHIVRAASVVRGELFGEPSKDGHIVAVPRYVGDAHRLTCSAFHPELSAACPLPAAGSPDDTVLAPTTAGLYNPLYYALVGWPTLIAHDASGIVGMRLVSALLSSLFAALAFAVVWTMRSRRVPLLAFAVAVTPMLLFLSGSVNPNAVEATATLAVFCGMLAIVLSPDPARLRGRAAIVAVAAVLAVNARGLSPLWVLVALAVPLLLADRSTLRALFRRPAVLLTAGLIGAGTLAAVAWTLATNSLANAIAHPEEAQAFPLVGAPPLTGFSNVLFDTVEYAHGLIGLFGWLDTPAPGIVLYGWGLAVGAIAVGALLVLRGRRLAAAIALIAAFVLLPPLVQAAYIHGGGMIWQGRYALPLFLCLVIGVAALLADQPFADGAAWRRLRVLVLIGAAGGQLWAFAAALRRYAVGSAGSLHTFLFGDAAWAPVGGVLPVLLATTAVIVVAALLLLRATDREADALVIDPAVAPAVRPAAADRAARRAIPG